MSGRETILCTVSGGLEEPLLAEARALGAARRVGEGVEIVGEAGLHRRANLLLRTADRVWWLGKGRRDTSGEPLYRRGFRQEVSRAPLRETIAAGMLAYAGYTPQTPLWDPLCGSGTILIEAAMQARGIAPGLSRPFAFEQLPGFDAAAFAQDKERIVAQIRPKAPALLLGTDLNAGALGTARRNAKRAGVLEDLTLERADATVARSGLPAGTIAVSNLPYGIRVGEKDALPDLYARLGTALRASGVTKVALLVKAEKAEAWLGLKEATVHPLSNGGIRCRLLVATP